MRVQLPGWVKDNRTSIREEVAPYSDLSPSERARLVGIACRTAMAQLHGRPDREAILRASDPIPTSSRQHLQRLRAEYRASHG